MRGGRAPPSHPHNESSDQVADLLSQSSIEDSQERTRMGLHELNEGKFESTSSSSSSSFITSDAKYGVDIEWLHEHSFKLFLPLTMDPLVLFSQGKSRKTLLHKQRASAFTRARYGACKHTFASIVRPAAIPELENAAL